MASRARTSPSPLQAAPLAPRLQEELLRLMEDEDLHPGDPMPSTAEISERFGVSRPVVREALSALAALGAIEIINGRGAVVRAMGDDAIRVYLRLCLRASRSPEHAALMELRAPLEMQAARLAAQRADQAEREGLRAHLAHMDTCLHDPEAYIAADAELHRMLGEIAQNRALSGILSAVRAPVLTAMARSRELHEATGRVGIEHEEHHAIVAAVLEGNADGAERAMRSHMDRVLALILERPDGGGAASGRAGDAVPSAP